MMIVSASFSDYLYILAGIAWLAFSAYKGQKKKKTSENQPAATSGKSFFESLIDQMGPEQVVSPLPPVVGSGEEEFLKEEIAEPVIFSYDDAVEESNEYETSVVYRKQEEKPTGIVPRVQVNNVDNQRNRRRVGFNLRSAVIYSEILKPKYF